MIRFEMDVAAADLERRTIEGVIVPYRRGRPHRRHRLPLSRRARSGSRARGRRCSSTTTARAPVGVLADRRARDDGVLARFSVDATPAGDRALIQAASGSRGALSVGAELDDYARGGGRRRRRHRGARARGFALALGAFERAGVTRVAAERRPRRRRARDHRARTGAEPGPTTTTPSPRRRPEPTRQPNPRTETSRDPPDDAGDAGRRRGDR